MSVFRTARSSPGFVMTSGMTKGLADVWVVAGAPGSGKTTVSTLLLKNIKPHPALLDRDTMYNSFEEAILSAAKRPLGEREGVWYDDHIKPHVYAGLAATAREIRSYGCTVLLSAPLTEQIHSTDLWQEWIAQLGGGRINLVWIQTDKETLYKRLTSRDSERDTEKLVDFDKSVNLMQIDSRPPVKHAVVDNRFAAVETLENQVKRIVQNYS